MRITKIKMQNFRLLKDISVDLESGLSVIIGKNNTGKTSFLLCLEKFIGGTATRNTFTFEDLNSDVKDNLLKIVSGTALNESSIGIVLKVFIEYDDDDDLENIGDKVIMDLDPDNKVVVLAFEYKATTDDIATLVEDFKELTAKK
ncbi:AAA family ATPase, partial [Pseudomonas savastanoi]